MGRANGHSNGQALLFAKKLRRELKRQDLGVRTLARRIDSENSEVVRRSLNKWLSGNHMPSPANRVMVAEALGVSVKDLTNDDDEDDDAVKIERGLALLDDLYAALSYVKAHARDEVEA